MKEGIRRILEKTKALPPAPTVSAALSVLLKDDAARSQDFERIIRFAPDLTANLLRLANTDYFGRRRNISSIRRAVAVLGTDRIFELACGAWFCGVLPERIPGYDVSAKSLWIHSVAVGVLCEQLAVAARIRPPETAFAAGLLHDVGKLAVGTLLEDKLDLIMTDVHTHRLSFIEAERRALSMDHAEVGEILCDTWNLPKNIAYAAGRHHYPNDAPEDADQALIDLAHLADGLALSLGFGYDIGEMSRTVEAGALDRLLITENTVDLAVNDAVLNQIWEIGDMVSGPISC